MELHKENKMTAHALAIVFGPTLIWPELQSNNMTTNMVYQSRIVEFILLEYRNVFRWKGNNSVKCDLSVDIFFFIDYLLIKI